MTAMGWDFLMLLAVMFLAFLAVSVIVRLIAALLSPERRRRCANCAYYDSRMRCCRVKWRKVNVTDKCGSFRRGKGGCV